MELHEDQESKKQRYVHTSRQGLTFDQQCKVAECRHFNYRKDWGEVKAGGRRAPDDNEFPMLEYEVPGSVRLRQDGWTVKDEAKEADGTSGAGAGAGAAAAAAAVKPSTAETEASAPASHDGREVDAGKTRGGKAKKGKAKRESLDWGDGSNLLLGSSGSSGGGTDSQRGEQSLADEQRERRKRSAASWFGVTVKDIGGVERVVELRLSRNGLAGAVPLATSLCKIEHLVHIDLSNSIFQNIRPPENERRIEVRDVISE